MSTSWIYLDIFPKKDCIYDHNRGKKELKIWRIRSPIIDCPRLKSEILETSLSDPPILERIRTQQEKSSLLALGSFESVEKSRFELRPRGYGLEEFFVPRILNRCCIRKKSKLFRLCSGIEEIAIKQLELPFSLYFSGALFYIFLVGK
ncbi:hypothetical protein MRB53_025087 [Persea americana]|uniref:Uncharacterized protein n=1 Tax=Persea americana TaxID=3435 RepID=A0ACC2LE75_PERAE|nr:hypothetical protein MRB53_025087 [Persea americana]